MKLFVGLSLLLITSQLAYANDIADFKAKYLIKLNGLDAGELTRELSSNDDGTRLFSSQSQATGLFYFFKPDIIKETSLWIYQDNQIQPIKYVYQRSGGKKEKFISLIFNWSTMKLEINDKKRPWSLPLIPLTFDKLIYQIALRHDLKDGKTHFNYLIADGGKIKDYVIEVVGKEIVTTPLGNIEALKLTRKRERKKDRETILWCAPTLNYLPVKLEHTEKSGARFTALLKQLSGITSDHAFEKANITKPVFKP